MPPKTKTAFQLDNPYADVVWPQISAQDQETIVELLANLLSPVGIHRKIHTPPSRGKRDKKRKHAEAVQTTSPTATIPSPPAPEISSQLLIGLNSISRHLSSSSATSCPSTLTSVLSKHAPELTLIVAATNNGMGIGNAGTLPWTGLQKEMAYFSRVTKRSPLLSNPLIPAQNVVIMGRKTWESIPAKFRPLPGRINIVLSRSYPLKVGKQISNHGNEPVKVASLEAAMAAIQHRPVGKIFIIGGAQIYAAALSLPNTKRILLTRILSDVSCDTHFPLNLCSSNSATGWEPKSKSELDAWTGEEVPQGEQEENAIKYTYEMWEKQPEPATHMSILFTTRQPMPPLTSHLPMLAHTASLAHTDKEATRLVVLPAKAEARICEALGIARAGFLGLLEGDAMGTKALVEFVREKVPAVEAGKWLEDGVKEYRETRINAVQVPVSQVVKKK